MQALANVTSNYTNFSFSSTAFKCPHVMWFSPGEDWLEHDARALVSSRAENRGQSLSLSGQHYNQCDKATNKDQARERKEIEREKRERNREKRGLAQWF